MADDNFTSTSTPKAKVLAATGGAAVGSALSVILIWALNLLSTKLGLVLPDNIQSAFETIFTSIATLSAGYYTAPGANEGVVVENGKVKSAVASN